MSVLVCGDPDALALAGTTSPDGPAGLVVALDDAAPPPGASAPVLRWWRTAPGRPPELGERVVAPQGKGLWSRAPWPVSDELFELPTDRAGAVLVVEADGDVRARVLAELKARNVEAVGIARLTVADLTRADVVLDGVGAAAPLSGDAFAVLAAGRVLVTNPTTAFGLLDGLHFLAGRHDLACNLVEAVARNPGAFAALRRTGRLAASEHRASVVYARLLAELEN